jgi:AcrR family transcriptional regulator
MRAQVEACATRPAPTPRERARRAYILEAGRAIFTAHGRAGVTLRDLAVATGLSQISIRNQIADLDNLFAMTLAKYLDEILAAIAVVPRHHADIFARRRAEYFRVTRGIFAVHTPIHFLLMRERFTLPEDELEPIEQRRRTLGFMLAGDAWETALVLLDSTHLDLPEIETMLEDQAARAQQKADAALDQAEAQAQPQTLTQANPPAARPPEARPPAPRPVPWNVAAMSGKAMSGNAGAKPPSPVAASPALHPPPFPLRLAAQRPPKPPAEAA